MNIKTATILVVGVLPAVAGGAGFWGGIYYATKKLGETFDSAVQAQVDKELDAISRRQNKSESELREATTKLQQMEDLVGDIQSKPIVLDLDNNEKVLYNQILPAAREFAERFKPPVPVTTALARYQGADPESRVEPSMDHPYQITSAMFEESVPGYDQIQLFYYAGDGVLADDREDIIEDPATIVGVEFPKWFGDLSGDENVVFIRNGARNVDFEITRSEGKYGEEVAGEMPDWLSEQRGDDA